MLQPYDVCLNTCLFNIKMSTSEVIVPEKKHVEKIDEYAIKTA